VIDWYSHKRAQVSQRVFMKPAAFCCIISQPFFPVWVPVLPSGHYRHTEIALVWVFYAREIAALESYISQEGARTQLFFLSDGFEGKFAGRAGARSPSRTYQGHFLKRNIEATTCSERGRYSRVSGQIHVKRHTAR